MDQGSPPLARERLGRGPGFPSRYRITPARAGKTRGMPDCIMTKGDHPRSRGKDSKSSATVCSNLGSPPLARERLPRLAPAPVAPGITPARAGKTFPTVLEVLFQGDHPRSRGKDSTASKVLTMVTGSPPLARERHANIQRFNKSIGITPARAGKTAYLGWAIMDGKDHPRSRGKDACNNSLIGTAVGSPPLARERH